MSKETTKTLTMPQAILAAGILVAVAILGSSLLRPTEVINSDDGTSVEKNEIANQAEGQEQELNTLLNVLPIEEGVDHVRGAENPTIVLYEYSDYECPFCGRFHDTMLRVLEEYPDDVAWVYRHLPLEGLHPGARPKAIAAECAFQQGGDDAFWAVTDHIFSDNPSVEETQTFALGLGLDEEAFQACLEDESLNERIDRDVVNAIQTLGGADRLSTPWSIMQLPDGNLVPIRGAQPYEAIEAVLQSVLN